jgi:hypothetical protein
MQLLRNPRLVSKAVPEHRAAQLVSFSAAVVPACPLWVIRVVSAMSPATPLYPQEPTSSVEPTTSEKCQRTNPLSREGAAARSGALHLPQ